MAKVVIYTTSYCPYCFGAKALLRSKHVEFEEIDVTDDPTQRAKMERLSARRTVPQIFIDAHPIAVTTRPGALMRLENWIVCWEDPPKPVRS